MMDSREDHPRLRGEHASQKLGGPEEPFKAWLSEQVNYHGSRRDLNAAQVAWIIDKLSKLPDHESETT